MKSVNVTALKHHVGDTFLVLIATSLTFLRTTAQGFKM